LSPPPKCDLNLGISHELQLCGSEVLKVLTHAGLTAKDLILVETADNLVKLI